MTNREQLYENYEDALFAILMDDLAETEGERLLELNQQLQDDPNAAIPDEVRQRCIAVINREFAKKKRAASVQRAKKALKILPWAVVIAMALMAVAFAAFPAFRAGVLNVLKINMSDNTTWRFYDSESGFEVSQNTSPSFRIQIPDGYIIEEYYSDSLLETIYCQNASNSESFFSVSVSTGSNAVIGIDNNNYTDFQILEIQGHAAELYAGEGRIWVTWADPSVPCY